MSWAEALIEEYKEVRLDLRNMHELLGDTEYNLQGKSQKSIA